MAETKKKKNIYIYIYISCKLQVCSTSGRIYCLKFITVVFSTNSKFESYLAIANFRFEFKMLALYLDHKARARDPLLSADDVLYEDRTCNQNSEEISKNKTCYGKTRDGYSDYKHITLIS